MAEDLPNLNNLPLSFVVDVLFARIESNKEQRAWEAYLVQYSRMSTKTFKQYKYEKPQKRKFKRRSKTEILEDAVAIRKSIAKG